MSIFLYNSLSKQKEEFKPIKKKQVGLYTCGPTVYNHPHIGNLMAYVVWDVLKRILIARGYKVKHIMNITDVGHLTSDADEGEDKLAKASRETGQNAWQIAEFFIKVFRNNLASLNIDEPTKFLRATETIKEQIAFARILDEKGYLYKTADGMYFDTSKIADYGKLANLSKVELQEGARVEKNQEKKNLTDFAVWKFTPEDISRDMDWESPWGLGFPGWHLECSVMSRLELGDTFDIHTGGIDHLTVHHPNEMAQSEAVTGKLQANYWLHNDFIKFEGGKMAKSQGTLITLENIREKGFSPLAFRFLILQNHYRNSLNFSFDSLQAAQNGLKAIIREIAFYGKPKGGCQELEEEFYQAIGDDLNTPKGLAILQKIIDSENKPGAKMASILNIDEVLGLRLGTLAKNALDISSDAKIILEERAKARDSQDWVRSDKLRDKLIALGVEVQDTTDGQKAIQVTL
ncbi:MAG: cysteine--tRNA ligase [Candidatus Komeilibacteria bacterium RIFOXYC1_FULL_37_11]|uniref:Cysteine--tRNA ligase n=1 Tax=Candidatus Komeilibacteria bacterium RIFOXYC1_FULL_37_11 TaxID=1798555 RepID=A0A1G2BX82_9BACT|nr:MAG: cysteine--tRNA ligase [Candidatus Komeilibacteria bacterium RIFOXYC1_FULL_37_11]OGY95814.1 MAG: cysteine--tRNA ligase [Candidatus Komeilibacteria bacterium RIFOXYD1_FULL_37_29]